MANELRKTGISIVGDIAWGTHFCSFYETTQDLLDILAPYFKAGWENNEFGLWVVSNSEFLTVQEAIGALRKAVPDLHHHLAERSIEVVGHDEWFLEAGDFDFHRVVDRFKRKLHEAVARGYAGMRLNGSPAWLQDKEQWRAFEQALDRLFLNERIIASCTYPLAESGATDMLDVTRTHQFSIVRRQGSWQVLETPELMQAKQEIQRLNEELEQRVVERTSELTAANEALRQSKSDLTEAQRVTRLGSWSLDLATNMVRWSDELYRIFDVEETAFDGLYEAFLSRVHPDDRARVLQVNAETRSSGDPFEVEYRITTRSGHLKHLRAIGYARKDCTGAVSGLFGTAQDITERKQAEEALRLSEQGFHLLTESIPILVWSARADGVSDYYNTPFLQYLGKTVEEMQGWVWVNTLHPDDRERSSALWTQAFSSGSDYEIEYRIQRAADGQYRWHLGRAVPLRDSSQKIVRWYGTCTDIHDRKQAEEKIRQYVAQIEALAEISRALEEVGLDYQSILNTVARRTAELIGDECGLFQLSEDRQRARPVAFHHPNPEVLALLRELLLNAWSGGMDTPIAPALLAGEPLRIPVVTPEEIRPSIQPEFWPYVDRVGISSLLIVPLRIQGLVIGTLSLSRNRPGHPYTYDDQVLLQDIADRAAMAIQNAQLFEQVQGAQERLRALSRQVLQAQEMERRAIARELHDEVGQQLTGLGLLLSASQQLSPSLAQAQLARAQMLVQDLMEQVRSLSFGLRPAVLDDFGLMPALAWLFERYTAQTNVVVRFEHRLAEEQRFELDVETGAYRIIQEALTNVARHAGVREVTVRLWTDGERLSVMIVDEGRGFDPQSIDTRTSSGLAGMQERAALLGGEVTIEAADGQGTRLTVSLPLHTATDLPEQE